MTDFENSTRDIAIETRADVRALRDLLQQHVIETRTNREQEMRILSEHSDLIQQIKGAKITLIAIVSLVTSVGSAAIMNFFGFFKGIK